LLAGGRVLQVWADAGWLCRNVPSICVDTPSKSVGIVLKNVVGLGKEIEFCYNGGKWPWGGVDVPCRGCRF
jgi:hypothetical protein